MDYLSEVKKFLESIPQFISNLEPGNPYTQVSDVPSGVWKVLDKFNIVEKDNGFDVTGRLAVPLLDLINLPGWHNYKALHPDIFDDRLYEMFLEAHSNFWSEFELEFFCNTFMDYYTDFLNNAGFEDGQIVVSGNSIVIKNVKEVQES